jgi:hypothetical protein
MGILNAKNFEFKFDEEKEWFRTQYACDPDTEWMELHDWCYVCGEKLIVPCIFWAGWPRSQELGNDRYQIWLHPGCAMYLAEKFLADVQRLKKMGEI